MGIIIGSFLFYSNGTLEQVFWNFLVRFYQLHTGLVVLKVVVCRHILRCQMIRETYNRVN